MTTPTFPDVLRRVSYLTRWALLIAASTLALVGAQTRADGPSVWDGVFTQAQAARGGRSYAEHCARCHGSDLRGGEYRALVGERFWTSWQETTLDQLFEHVSTTMPHSEDGSLKGTLGAPVYLDIVAHILASNEFPAGAEELTEASAVGVRIIKADGSGELPEGSFVQVVGCLAPRGHDGDWRLLRGSPPTRVERSGTDAELELGHREYVLKFVLTSLDASVGHRMSVRANLMGDGGVDGLNVTTVRSVSETCE